MDALSDVLKSVRLEGAVYLNAEFTAPWCVRAQYGVDGLGGRLRGAEHVVFFHFFAEGGCQVPLATGQVLRVRAGDVLMFPNAERQLMGSDLRLVPADAEALLASAAEPEADVVHLRHGGGGAMSRLICGYVACTRRVSRLLFGGLPEAIRVPMGDGLGAVLLQELLRVGVRESSGERPGAQSLLAKLSELLFVEALRRYVEGLPIDGTGWLAGVRDRYVGRALTLMHSHPERAWTVDQLAREVALSRSALAERFAALVVEAPMKYLARWRLGLAAQALEHGGESIARIAERSGYESEAAFNRAFKREYGKPPAAWRRSAARRDAR